MLQHHISQGGEQLAWGRRRRPGTHPFPDGCGNGRNNGMEVALESPVPRGDKQGQPSIP